MLLRVAACVVLAAAVSAVSLSDYVSPADQEQLKNLFNSQAPFKDAVSAYWSLRGLSYLKALPKDTAAVCKSLQSLKASTAESVFALTEAAALVKCSITKTAAMESTLKTALSQNKVSPIYFGYFGSKNLKLAVDNKAVNSALEKALQTDDTPTSTAYSFLLTTALNLDVEKRFSNIEDVMAQADIVNNEFMQFEGGLFTTALVVEGSYKLAAAAKKAPTIKSDQVLQLANYLVSRRHVRRLRSAAQLLAALDTLTKNSYHVPVVMSVDGAAVVSGSSSKLSVRVSDLLGGSVGKVTLTADSGRHIADDAVVLSKKQLTATKDASVFELDFASIKAPFGFYRMQLTAAPAKADAKLLGLKGAVNFKYVTVVKLDGVELGTSDKSDSAPQTTKLVHPQKAAAPLSADSHEKVFMKFTVKSAASGEALTVHQAFVRLTHKETQQEITYVATTAEGSSAYKFELGVGAKEKEFGSLSGLYEMSLLIGDAIIENPIEWNVADVELTFAGQPGAAGADTYKPKPVIEHMFRQPEKRPPVVVSNVFTALVLSPLLIMFVLWMRLGANVSNMPASLSALGFHLGLAGIFVLYFLYWTQLDMFETIKYLTIIGIPTFLFGNRLLSSIAAKRVKEL